MDLDSFKIIVDIIYGIVSTGAIIVGGIWAYKKLFIEAEHESSISVTLTCNLLDSHSENIKIMEIRAKLNNNGKVPCQIDLPHSYISINVVNTIEDIVQFASQEQEYSSCNDFKQSGIINIPVGATWEVVDFTLVEHPGIYKVEAFLSQTENAGRQFFKRIGQPFPDDWDENPSGWSDELIVHT